MLHMLFQSDLEVTKFILAISGFLWSLFLFWPGDTFSRKTYWIMDSMAPEWVWASAFFIQSTVMLHALLSGIRSRWAVVLDAVLGVFLWTFSTIACYLAHWPFDQPFEVAINLYAPPAAMSGEVGLTIASWWILVRYSMPKRVL